MSYGLINLLIAFPSNTSERQKRDEDRMKEKPIKAIPNHKLRVCVRVRPVIGEDPEGDSICLVCSHDGQTLQLNRVGQVFHRKRFVFDHVFDADISQSEVYRLSFKDMVHDTISKGINSNVLVYGQTGAGKTHTTFGSLAGGNAVADSSLTRGPRSNKGNTMNPDSNACREPNNGLLHHVVSDIFNAVENHHKEGLVARVYVQFYEIYLEQVYDLLPLAAATASKPLTIREDSDGKVYLKDLTRHLVLSEKGLIDLCKQGLDNRVTRATRQNASSSRSHAVLQIITNFEIDDQGSNVDSDEDEVKRSTAKYYLYGEEYENNDEGGGAENGMRYWEDPHEKDRRHQVQQSMNARRADLASNLAAKRKERKRDYDFYKSKHNVLVMRSGICTLVDLAGSERISKSFYSTVGGQQLKEAAVINKSISALGNCIKALAMQGRANKKTGSLNSANSTGSGQGTAAPHVPFRDSKLTRLLSDVLVGKSKTCFIGCVCPCSYSEEETFSTLRVASRATTLEKQVESNDIVVLGLNEALIATPPHSPTSGVHETWQQYQEQENSHQHEHEHEHEHRNQSQSDDEGGKSPLLKRLLEKARSSASFGVSSSFQLNNPNSPPKADGILIENYSLHAISATDASIMEGCLQNGCVTVSGLRSFLNTHINRHRQLSVGEKARPSSNSSQSPLQMKSSSQPTTPLVKSNVSLSLSPPAQRVAKLLPSPRPVSFTSPADSPTFSNNSSPSPSVCPTPFPPPSPIQSPFQARPRVELIMSRTSSSNSLNSNISNTHQTGIGTTTALIDGNGEIHHTWSPNKKKSEEKKKSQNESDTPKPPSLQPPSPKPPALQPPSLQPPSPKPISSSQPLVPQYYTYEMIAKSSYTPYTLPSTSQVGAGLYMWNE